MISHPLPPANQKTEERSSIKKKSAERSVSAVPKISRGDEFKGSNEQILRAAPKPPDVTV